MAVRNLVRNLFQKAFQCTFGTPSEGGPFWSAREPPLNLVGKFGARSFYDSTSVFAFRMNLQNGVLHGPVNEKQRKVEVASEFGVRVQICIRY